MGINHSSPHNMTNWMYVSFSLSLPICIKSKRQTERLYYIYTYMIYINNKYIYKLYKYINISKAYKYKNVSCMQLWSWQVPISWQQTEDRRLLISESEDLKTKRVKDINSCLKAGKPMAQEERCFSLSLKAITHQCHGSPIRQEELPLT